MQEENFKEVSQIYRFTFQSCSLQTCFSSSEIWVLPIVVFFALVAYVILATIFYNNDG